MMISLKKKKVIARILRACMFVQNNFSMLNCLKMRCDMILHWNGWFNLRLTHQTWSELWERKMFLIDMGQHQPSWWGWWWTGGGQSCAARQPDNSISPGFSFGTFPWSNSKLILQEMKIFWSFCNHLSGKLCTSPKSYFAIFYNCVWCYLMCLNTIINKIEKVIKLQ